jgi:cytochrome c
MLLLGGLVLTALSVWRRPVPVLASKTQGASVALSIFPLIAACAGIMLATMLWLATQRWSEASERDAAARAMTGGDPRQAVTLMIRYGCAGCHTIPGVPGADGQVGAPLTQMRKRVFIAGALPNSASNLIDWIVQPEAHDPQSAMPLTGITRAEARDVAAWLYSR